MNNLEETLVTDIADEARERGGTVSDVTSRVQEEAKKTADDLRRKFGEGMDEIAGKIIAESKSYADSKKALLDPKGKVDDAASDGAAAYVTLADKSVTYDDAALAHDLSDQQEAYWEGVVAHEKVHQTEQAPSFNASSIEYQGGSVPVHPALVEWQAIAQAGQKMNDLTPDYVRHYQAGQKLAAYIGKSALTEALKSGDMQALQRKVLEKELAEKKRLPTAKAAATLHGSLSLSL